LKFAPVWQPSRLYWNTSRFFLQQGQELDTVGLAKEDVGKFNPLLGMAYSELAAFSRSMHKSQGFGATGSRGEELDWLTQWKGEKSTNAFKGINTTWTRVKGGEKVQPHVDAAIKKFNPLKPWEIAPELMAARKEIAKLTDNFWRDIKLQEVDELIRAVAGLYLEVRADRFDFTPGDQMNLELEAVNRSPVKMNLVSAKLNGWDAGQNFSDELNHNVRVNKKWSVSLPANLPYSHPYWLEQTGTIGLYRVDDQNLRGIPENKPAFTANVVVDILGEQITMELPVAYKRNDPVNGETYTPVIVQPEAMVNIEGPSLIFSNGDSKQVIFRVIAGKENISGVVRPVLPKGWSASPAQANVKLDKKGEEQLYTFSIKPPVAAFEGELKAEVEIQGKKFTRGRTIINYDHIPVQTLFPQASVKLVKLDLVKKGTNIGYIMGAGDEIPENLRQVGYTVTLLEKDDVNAANMKKYDAVILGVRAFNTVDWLAFKNKELFDYAKQGGTVIVQYNTSNALVTRDIAPFPLTLSRERVTVEEAEVRFLDKGLAVLMNPNKISSADFSGWVQERGLYFGGTWDSNFIPVLSSNDPGEPARDGGLLIAKYGEGYYVYTGYAWFRQLPAGVPGAYRLFVNLISLGK
jgi:hypothetical protein